MIESVFGMATLGDVERGREPEREAQILRLDGLSEELRDFFVHGQLHAVVWVLLENADVLQTVPLLLQCARGPV